MVPSILYILAFPAIWTSALFVPAYMGSRFVKSTHSIVQILSLFWMSMQFTTKHTNYYKASEKSDGVLPMNKYD
jgi:hypothetical protein